jgi:hypothetical protein
VLVSLDQPLHTVFTHLAHRKVVDPASKVLSRFNEIDVEVRTEFLYPVADVVHIRVHELVLAALNDLNTEVLRMR